MITQSFKVLDLLSQREYKFTLNDENVWIMTINGKNREVTQKEVDGSYNYFSCHWQDYDITII